MRLAALFGAIPAVLIGACGQRAGNEPALANAPAPASRPAPASHAGNVALRPEGARVAPRSCAAEMGAAARRLVDLCISVSPASHPPCNAANSCAMIEDEIARGCAFIGDGADRPAQCGPAERSPEAAVATVRLYYRALAARDYPTAYAQWADRGGASGNDYESFAAGFARTRATRVATGAPRDMEGAAGSSFVTVPVTVDAELDDDTRQHFVGSYTLRRVNDVPGATPDDLRWRIVSASLRGAR
jgi:hypothetical protein